MYISLIITPFKLQGPFKNPDIQIETQIDGSPQLNITPDPYKLIVCNGPLKNPMGEKKGIH